MAKPRASGADAVQLIGFENVYGTPPDGSGGGVYYQMPMRSDDIGAAQPLEADDTWNRGTPDDGDASAGAETVSGEMALPVDARGVGVALIAALGLPATEEITADTLWEHVFLSGADLPSISKQVGHPKLATPKWRTQYGGKVDTLAAQMSRTGRQVFTLGTICQGEQKDVAGARDADPIVFPYLPYDACKGGVTLGGVGLANLTGGGFTFSNGLDAAETIRGDNRIDGVDETIRSASGQATIRLGTDAAIDNAVDNVTYGALEFAWTIAAQGTWFLKVQFPRVRFERAKKPINGPGGIEQTVNWRASHDTGAGYLMRVLLRNGVEEYAV